MEARLHHCPPRRRRRAPAEDITLGLLVAGGVVGWLAYGAVAAAAPAAPPDTICVAGSSGLAGLDAAAVTTALRLQGRKQGTPLRVYLVATAGSCERGGATVALGPAQPPTWQLDPDDAPRPYRAAQRPAAERAPELAALMLAALQTEARAADAAFEPLVDLSVPVTTGPPAGEAGAGRTAAGRRDEGAGPERQRVAVVLGAGSTYGVGIGQGWPAAASLSVEPALELLDGGLSLGAWLAWSPAHAVDSDAPQTTLSASTWEVAAALRAGLRRGRWLLRLGLLAGWQRRAVQATSTLRFEPVHASTSAWLVDLQPELALCLWGDHLRVGFVASARGYLGGVDHTWAGGPLETAPRGELALMARAGVRL